MTSPHVELKLDGVWTDITDRVYTRDPVTITRGTADETSRLDPGTLSMTLNNRDGRFSPRNPGSPYYGQIGRNTPVRVYVNQGVQALLSPGIHDRDRVTAPDTAANSVTGDVDIRIDLEAHNWSFINLAAKYEADGDQRSWLWATNQSGTLFFQWSDDGAATFNATSTEAISTSPGRRTLRVTLTFDADAEGHEVVTFYTGIGISGPWTQLGDPVEVFAGAGLFDSTAPLQVGDATDINGLGTRGRIYSFQLHDGIDGTLVANPEFFLQTEGTESFTDSTGNTWTVRGDAEITNRWYRFHGEISSWPQRWDTSDADIYAPVEGAGIFRRLSAGAAALKSAIRRELASPDSNNPPVAYWPCEDSRHADTIASALAQGGPMTIVGDPRLAADTTFVASSALPTLRGGSFRGRVPVYDNASGNAQVRFLLSIPDEGSTDDGVLMSIRTTGDVERWDLSSGADGSLQLDGFLTGDSTPSHTVSAAFDINGQPARVSVQFAPQNGDLDFTIVVLKADHDTGEFLGNTATGTTLGRVSHIVVNPNGAHDNVAMGHVSVHPQITSIFDLESLHGHVGETSGRRMQRLAAEENLTVETIGEIDEPPRLGAQLPVQLVDLFQEAADSDSGVLYEPRGQLAVGFRSHLSFYNQTPVINLDYAAGQVASRLEPIDDDQQTVNDVTVSAGSGSSARVVQETGPLSVAAPPDGVGRYDTDVSVSAAHNELLPHMAGWRVHLGTIDETRYPSIGANFATEAVAADEALFQSLLFAEVGDRLVVSNPPPWLPPEPISQIIRGYTEEWEEPPQHTITFNCSPESPYQVATLDETGVTAARYGAGSPTTPIFEDFEDDDLNIALSGTWARSSDSSGGGTWSLKSATITHGETTDAVIQIPPWARWIRFRFRVSSEQGFDFFRVLVDGREIANLSGDSGWALSNPTDVTGAAEITFRYEKDGSVSELEDAAWIDDITFGGTGSYLETNVSDSATSLEVTTNLGPLWTTDAAEMSLDILVGGEQMTVTAISGTSSPQTFTVTRSVNGVIKSHSVGTAVELFKSAHRAL